jgi:hypothetical protein
VSVVLYNKVSVLPNKVQKRFSCALPNKVMCFTKQNTNNLTRREIQNLFSQKTKAKATSQNA